MFEDVCHKINEALLAGHQALLSPELVTTKEKLVDMI